MYTNHDSNILDNTLNVTNTRKYEMNTTPFKDVIITTFGYRYFAKYHKLIFQYMSLKNLMITSRHVLKLEAGQKNK